MQKKDIIELWITVVLAVLLAVACFALTRRTETSRKILSPAAVKPVQKRLNAPPASPSYRLYRKKSVDEKFLNRLAAATSTLALDRDPFHEGSTAASASQSGLVLEGIMWDAKKPTVVINSHFLNEGDSFDRFKVVKIHPTKVVLQEGDAEFELVLTGANQNTEEINQP